MVYVCCCWAHRAHTHTLLHLEQRFSFLFRKEFVIRCFPIVIRREIVAKLCSRISTRGRARVMEKNGVFYVNASVCLMLRDVDETL